MEVLVNIDVDDLDLAIPFYCSAFGLRPGRRLGSGAVELVGGAVIVFLLARDAGTPAFPGAAATRHYTRHWTPVHLDLVVDDIDAAVQRALAAGATMEKPIHASRWGKLALMSDPFGHGFCFVQFLGDGYDALADTAEPTGTRSR